MCGYGTIFHFKAGKAKSFRLQIDIDRNVHVTARKIDKNIRGEFPLFALYVRGSTHYLDVGDLRQRYLSGGA